MMPGVPVRIRGVTYPSLTAAGKALGVNPSTVAMHLDNGTIDRTGLGQSHARPYTYAGVTYSSMSTAALALDIPGSTFSDRVKKGRDPVTGKLL